MTNIHSLFDQRERAHPLPLRAFFRLAAILLGTTAMLGFDACKGKAPPAASASHRDAADSQPAAAERDSGIVSKTAAASSGPQPPLPMRFIGGATTPDSLIRSFMAGLLAQNGREAYDLLPTFKEYESVYPYMPNPDPNPNSPRTIASMLSSSNQKELPRWMGEAKDLKGFSRYELGPVEKHRGYELVTKVRLFVHDAGGREREFPVFRTLIRIGGQYKIWLLLEY